MSPPVTDRPKQMTEKCWLLSTNGENGNAGGYYNIIYYKPLYFKHCILADNSGIYLWMHYVSNLFERRFKQ